MIQLGPKGTQRTQEPRQRRQPGPADVISVQPNANYETSKRGIEHRDPVIAANVMIGLVKLTNYLLDQQLRHLEEAFVTQGGLRERMTRARLAERAKGPRP